MSESDLAIVAALVFAWGAVSARLERFDVTAPIVFILAGLALTHGPLVVLEAHPSPELIKAMAEVTLVLVLLLSFGAVAVAPALRNLTWQSLVYSVLSLTLIRMVPVALALAGTRLGWPTVAFTGWFGPRGLASVVFALLALEDLGSMAAKPAVAVISVTVVLSVIAHGVTAEPLAGRYAAALGGTSGGPAHAERPELPPRKLIRHGHAVVR